MRFLSLKGGLCGNSTDAHAKSRWDLYSPPSLVFPTSIKACNKKWTYWVFHHLINTTCVALWGCFFWLLPILVGQSDRMRVSFCFSLKWLAERLPPPCFTAGMCGCPALDFCHTWHFSSGPWSYSSVTFNHSTFFHKFSQSVPFDRLLKGFFTDFFWQQLSS